MVQFTFKEESGIIKISDQQRNVVNYDLEGRPVFFSINAKTYRRGLNNRLINISWEGEYRIVNQIHGEESDAIIDQGLSMLRSSYESLQPGSEPVNLAPAGRNLAWLKDDARKISSLYNVYPILPPEASHCVYIEATSGANWNLATIAGAYAKREFTQKQESEIASHVTSVKETLGRGISSRREVFLGDTNVLNMDQKLLIRTIELLKSEFNLPVVASFDMYTTPKKKNMIHFRDMKDHGLNKVVVFVQSGSYKVLRLFNEHTNATETLNLVNNMKDSGLSVDIVALLGTGGLKYSRDHEEGITNMVSQMLLDQGDTIYLSPMVEDADPWYAGMAKQNSLGRLSAEQKHDQMIKIAESVKKSFSEINGKPFPGKITEFDMRETIY